MQIIWDKVAREVIAVSHKDDLLDYYNDLCDKYPRRFNFRIYTEKMIYRTEHKLTGVPINENHPR